MRPREVGTAHAEEESGHASEDGCGFVRDSAPGVLGYKHMGARRGQSLSEVWLAIIREIVGLSGSGRLPDPLVVEERG